MPPNLRSVSASPSQSAETSAPKNGLVALMIAAAEALMYCSAKQKSAKGNAEFTVPITR